MTHYMYALQAILVAACWGGNFIAARITMDDMSPFFVLAIRFVIVTVILLPFFPRPIGRMKDLVLLSILLGTLHFSLLYIPLRLGLDVSSAVISSQLGVPFSCLLGSIFFKDHIGRWRALGIFVSLIGVIIICGSPRIMEQYWQFMLACCGAFTWSVGNIISKRFDNYNMLGVLAWMSLLCIPQLTLLTILMEDNHMQQLRNSNIATWTAIFYTALFSTIVAYGLWYHLMNKYSVSQIVPFSLLVPVFGLSLAQWVFKESTGWQFYAGCGLTLIGVAIIVFRKPRNATVHTQPITQQLTD